MRRVRLVFAIATLLAIAVMPALSAPTDAASTASPVLSYAFDSATARGLVPDSSPNHLDGTFVGGVLADALVPGMTGHGSAIQLHGDQHQYVAVPQSPALDVGKYTLSAWVNYTGITNDATNGRWEVLEKAGAYWLNVRTTGRVRVGGFYGGCGTAAWKYFDSSRSIPTNRWVHVASTYNGTRLRVYINGRAAGSRAVTGTTCHSSDPLAVGAKNAPAKGLLEAFWDGKLDDVRIYPAALTGAQIAQLAGH